MPCIVRRTALSEGRHCQKDAFTRAAETDNALLVQVKQNQPTLQDTLARLCARQQPLDSHETGGVREHRLVEVFDTSWTPRGSR
jgi:hypothetical protein